MSIDTFAESSLRHSSSAHIPRSEWSTERAFFNAVRLAQVSGQVPPPSNKAIGRRVTVPDLSLALAKTTDRCECFLSLLDANHFDIGWPIQNFFPCLPKIEKLEKPSQPSNYIARVGQRNSRSFCVPTEILDRPISPQTTALYGLPQTPCVSFLLEHVNG
jgi:hypothetical protein